MLIHWGILKQPIGMLKVAIFILNIISLATTMNPVESSSFTCYVNGSQPSTYTFSQEFPYDTATVCYVSCTTVPSEAADAPSEAGPRAKFFVAIHFISMFIVLAELGVHMFLEEHTGSPSWRRIEFVVSGCWSLFTLTSTAIWASYLPTLEDYSEKVDTFYKSALQGCTFTGGFALSFGSIKVSVAFAFLGMFLWIGNTLITYKLRVASITDDEYAPIREDEAKI